MKFVSPRFESSYAEATTANHLRCMSSVPLNLEEVLKKVAEEKSKSARPEK